MIKVFKPACILLALSLFLFAGCLERQFAESKAELSATVGELVVPADMFEGPGLVTDTLTVTANRSWSATFEPEVDWVEMDLDEHLDLSEISEDIRIPLNFKDNPDAQPRQVVLHLRTADSDREVKIVQKGKVGRLVFIPEESDEMISAGEAMYECPVRCEEDTAVVAFNSNTIWTAKVVDGASASVKLSKTSGTGNYQLKVIFGENDDPNATKEAKVVVSAEGCDDIRLQFSQAAGIPYIKILSHNFPNINIPSIGARVTFEIKSNVAWRMKVKDGETLQAKFAKARRTEDGSIVKDEANRNVYDYLDEYVAEKGETEVIAALLGNPDFDKDQTITLQAVTEGGEAVAEETFTVDRLSRVFLVFRKYPDVFSSSSTSTTYYHPFTVDLYGTSYCLENNHTWQAWNGYEFRMHTAGTVRSAGVTTPSARMAVISHTGLNVGTSYNMCSVSFPAVPGKRLAKVTAMYGYSSTNVNWVTYGITTKEYGDKIEAGEYKTQVSSETPFVNNIPMIKGGELRHPVVPVRKDITYNNPAEEMEVNPNSVIVYELPDTEVNTPYYFVSSYAMGFKWFELIYE